MLLLAVVVLALTTGATCWANVHGLEAVLADVTENSQLSVAALDIYQSLSDADTTMASAFLVYGSEPTEQRKRYRDDLASAATSLVTVSAVGPTDPNAGAVDELARDLPVYAGLVETAWTNRRQRLQVSTAYLREASFWVRDTMLPTAKQLFEAETNRQADSQRASGTLPWLPLALGALTIGSLVAVQLHLAALTNRLVNVGLLAATLLTMAVLGWLAAVAVHVTHDSDAGLQEGTRQVQAFADARIAGLQARSDEAITLVARGDGAFYDQRFDGTVKRLDRPGGLLDQAMATAGRGQTRASVEAATVDLRHWRDVHLQVRRLDDEGSYASYTEAVGKAIGSDPGSSGSLAQAFDGHLAHAIWVADLHFKAATDRARGALAGAGPGTGLLMLLAAAAAAAGMWPRIAEYR